MTIQIIPSDPLQPAAAAFIRGSSPAEWLHEINRWGISTRQLSCYLLPESSGTRRPAGLFVVPQDPGVLTQLDGLDLFTAVVPGRFFIPRDSALSLAVEAAEWPRLLAWELQVFHPVFGFIGFYKEDLLDLSLLLEIPPQCQTDWSKAQPGFPQAPPFNRIEVPRPPTRSIFQNMEKEMGDSPRSGSAGRDASKDAGEKASENLKDKIEQMLDGLDQKRREEMERLLTLFQQNKGDALRYAPPLNDPYAGRGTAPPSWILPEQIPDFSLEHIGGGQASSSWQIQQELYEHLRRLYLETANEAAARGDFRIAAYIHAHLLGDFNAAANCLEQGKYYREAATLYRDHLNNLPMAAACLERGGLLAEAAEIQEELKAFEKAGDLYQRMEQPERALVLYQKTAQIAMESKDFLEAARLMETKIAQPEAALHCLLLGWEAQRQSEPCLRKYLDLQLRLFPNDLASNVKKVFDQHTPPGKRPLFLQGLLHLNHQKTNQETKDLAREIAYQIISEEAQKGKEDSLKWLKQFRSDDRLLEGDTSRYVHRKNKLPAQRKAGELLAQLSAHVQWRTVVRHEGQWLALGRQDYMPLIARGRGGQVDYHYWQQYLNPTTTFNIVHDPIINNRIILQPNEPVVLEWKELPTTEIFKTALLIGAPGWLPTRDRERLAIVASDQITGLENSMGQFLLKNYDAQGHLLQVKPCQGEAFSSLSFQATDTAGKLICLDSVFYTHVGQYLLKIQADGQTSVLDFDEPITFVRHWEHGHVPEALLMVCTESGNSWCLRHHYNPLHSHELTHSSLIYTGPANQYKEGRFVLPNRFVLASPEELVVLSLESRGGVSVRVIPLHAPVVAMMPTDHQRFFAVLHQTGELRVY